jgi:hypothetical protein
MTVEDRCKVCKELIKWSAFEDSSVMYMEDRVYAVAVWTGVVALVEADDPDKAYEKVFGFKPRGNA